MCRNLGTRSSVRPKKIRSSHLSTFFSFHLSHFQDYFNCAGCWSLDDNVQNKRPLRQPASQGWRRSRSSCEEPGIYMQLWTSTRSMLKITLISLHDLMTTILNKHWSHLRTNPQFPLLDHRGGPVGPIVGGRHLDSCSWSVSGIIVLWSPSLSALSLSLCLTLSPPQIKNISKGTSSAGTISSSSSSSALKEKVKGLQFTSRALKCLTGSRVRYWVWHSLTVYTLIYRLYFAEDVFQIDTLIIQIRDAFVSKKCSFFEHCSKGLWPPPPFIWTFVLFCRGCFLNAFLSIKNGSNIQWPEWAPHI